MEPNRILVMGDMGDKALTRERHYYQIHAHPAMGGDKQQFGEMGKYRHFWPFLGEHVSLEHKSTC